MPTLIIHSSVPQDEDSFSELNFKLTEFLALTLDQPKSFIQIILTESAVRFGTTPGPSAFAELFCPDLSDKKISEMNGSFSKILARYLGVTEERIIVQYTPVKAHHRSWNGRLGIARNPEASP